MRTLHTVHTHTFNRDWLHVLVFETYTYYMYTVHTCTCSTAASVSTVYSSNHFFLLLKCHLYTHSLPRSSWSYSICPGTEPGRSRGQVWVSRGHQCPGYDHPHHSPVHHHSVWRLHSTYTKGGAVCTCTNWLTAWQLVSTYQSLLCVYLE